MRNRQLTLFFSHMANDTLYAALPPILPVLAVEHSLSVAALGLIPAVYMVTASFLQMAIGVLHDRKQVSIFMSLGLLLGGLSIASIGFLKNYVVMIAAAVLGGVGSALFHPVATSLSSVSSRRSISVSIFMTGGDLGLALGSLVSAFAVSLMGLNGTVFLLVMPLVMAIVLTSFRAEGSNNHGNGLGEAVKSAGYSSLSILLGAAVLRGVTIMSIITYLPLYLASQGYFTAYAGGVLTLMLLAGAVGMVAAGVLSGRFGKRHIAVSLLLFSSVLTLLIVFTPLSYVILPISLLGFVILAVQPLLIAISHDLLPNNLGTASALMYGFNIGVANLVVPLVGFLIDLLGYVPVFAMLSAMPVTAAALISRIRLEKEKLQKPKNS